MINLSLSHLPPEILSCIVANVQSKSALLNLALCSHGFYTNVIQHLYKHIEVCDLFPEGVERHPQFQPLQNLASLLLRRPDLAQHVRSWTMRDANGLKSRQTRRESKTLRTAQVDTVLKTAIKASSFSGVEETEWLEHCSWIDHGDAILALLLPVLHNLQTLDLNLSYTSSYIERALGRASCGEKPFDTKPALKGLTNFMATSAETKRRMKPDYIAVSMPLPSICAIYGHSLGSIYDDEGDKRLAELPIASSNLTHLELRNCTMNKPDITYLLRIPKNLTTFIYDLGSGHLSYCDITPEDIFNALAPQEHCLENLWIDYNQRFEEEWMADYDSDSTDPGGSFSRFECLKVLKIAAVFLFGGLENKNATGRQLADLLPDTLHTLHVNNCDDNFPGTLHTLEELILHKSDYVPELKKLVLKGSTLYVQLYYAGLQRLAGIARSQGVSLSVQLYKWDADWKDWVEQGWGMNESIWWNEGPRGLNRLPRCQPVDVTIDEEFQELFYNFT